MKSFLCRINYELVLDEVVKPYFVHPSLAIWTQLYPSCRSIDLWSPSWMQ